MTAFINGSLMKLFGGDPRSLFLVTLFKFNKYYSAAVILCFLCLLPNRATDSSFLIVYIFFSVVEIVRLLLVTTYVGGSLQCSIIFTVLTLVPILVIDIFWIFYVETRSALDYVAMIAMIIIHAIELIYSCFAISWMNDYTTRFYRFRYGKNPEIFTADDDGVVRD